MHSKKSILFFTSFPPPVTGQRVATKLFYDLLGNYYNVDSINLSPQQENLKKPSGFKLILTYVYKYVLLVKKLKKGNYDFVYVVFAPSKSGLLKDFLSASIIKRLNKGKLISHLHCGNYGENFKNFFFSNIFRSLVQKVDTFIFLSPVLNKVDALLDGKAVYINNTISSEIICTDEEVENKINSKLNRHSLSIYYISNMIREKGYEDLVTAADILKKEQKITFNLHLIGAWPRNNEEEKKFKKNLNLLHLQDTVHVYGAVNDRKKIKQFFLNADIFVLPTYYPIEAQPLSIIEALNAGTPVISTRHASVPDLVQDDINGYLVNPKDASAIADAVRKLDNKQNWQKIADNARESFKRNYEQSIVFQKLLNIFS